MNFRDPWINVFHRAAKDTKKARTLLTPIGVFVFGVFTSLFVIAAIYFDKLLGFPRFLPESVRILLSIPFIAVGIGVTAWSAFHFLKAKGTPVPFNPPPKVVDTGPYRYARNPMLTGVFLFMFGVGFGINSISLVFFFTPLYIWTHVWELREIEEPELMKRLGDSYDEYRKRTPMFFPKIKQRMKPHDKG